MEAEDKNKDICTQRRIIMTRKQREAYDEFIDYMVYLYKKYSYLFEDDET